jgi:hypothetical protein
VPERPGEGIGAKYRKQFQQREAEAKRAASKLKAQVLKKSKTAQKEKQFRFLTEVDVSYTIEKDIDERTTQKKAMLYSSLEAVAKKSQALKVQKSKALVAQVLKVYFDKRVL